MIFAVGQIFCITYWTTTFQQKVIIEWAEIYSEA